MALQNRIQQDDLQQLVLLDPTPLQDDLFDPTLSCIEQATEKHDARYWVERISDFSDDIRECALARLIERGILERASERIQQVRKLDLIGQAVSRAIWEIETTLASAMLPYM